MKSIILGGALMVLIGCGPRHPIRQVAHLPVNPVVDHIEIPRSAANEAPAVRKPEAEPAPEEVSPALGVRPLNSKVVIDQTNGRLQDIYFDYDQSAIRSDALATIQENAKLLAPVLDGFPRVTIWIEGHCDERGSAEYNLGLGSNRASRVAEALSNLGLGSPRLHTISYGNQMPQCAEPTESCWQQNRRAHIFLREGDAPKK